MMIIPAVVAVALASLAAAHAPRARQQRFGDAAKWAQIFDHPQRDGWQRPQEVIGTLARKADAVMADTGAGYFAVRFAQLPPQGRVYAIDTEPDMARRQIP